MNMTYLYATIGAGVLALLFAYWKTLWVNKQDCGTDKMKEIGAAIREGAMAFLAREYRVLAIFVIVVAALLAAVNKGNLKLVAVSFVVGSLCSGLAGFFGMRIATAANMRTTNGARRGLSQALAVAFSGGTVMGMCVVGLGTLGLSILFLIYTHFFGSEIANLQNTVLPILNGFAMVPLQSLFLHGLVVAFLLKLPTLVLIWLESLKRVFQKMIHVTLRPLPTMLVIMLVMWLVWVQICLSRMLAPL